MNRPESNPATQTPLAKSIPQWSNELGREIGGFRGFLTKYRQRIAPFDAILSVLEVGKRYDVLDIGGGEGLLLWLFAKSGYLNRGLCVDANPKNIAVGTRAFLRLDESAIKLSCTSSIDGWPDDKFDIVSMIDVMHHVPPALHRDFITEACARVKDGGMLIYKDMADEPLLFAAANRLHDLVLARDWITYAPIEEVCSFAAECGLTLKEAKDMRTLWYAHELRVFERLQV
ncbi:MAG: class I SAM-dependent methyltransferase [Pseudomonadota bacterium]